MIRIIVRTDDANMVANVGGSVKTEFTTFDIDAPALEAFLAEPKDSKWVFVQRQAVGVETLPTKTP